MTSSAAQPPTRADQALANATKDLGPDRGLERAEQAARFVFANVTIVGGVLTAAGLTTDAGQAWVDGPSLFGVSLAVGLISLALLLATAALIPGFTRVNLDDLDAVERYFTRQTARRGVFAILAMLALAAAVVAALVTAAQFGDTAKRLVVSGSVVAHPPREAVEAKASAGGLHAGDIIQLVVSVGGPTVRRTVLCRAETTAGQQGTGSSSCPPTLEKAGIRLTARAVVLRGTKTVRSRTLSLGTT